MKAVWIAALLAVPACPGAYYDEPMTEESASECWIGGRIPYNVDDGWACEQPGDYDWIGAEP